MFDRASRSTVARRAVHGIATLPMVIAALLHGATARAQTPPGEPQSAESETLEAIVVTARRREESLQDTPIAITALSAGRRSGSWPP